MVALGSSASAAQNQRPDGLIPTARVRLFKTGEPISTLRPHLPDVLAYILSLYSGFNVRKTGLGQLFCSTFTVINGKHDCN
jgi:hypothetical protein